MGKPATRRLTILEGLVPTEMIVHLLRPEHLVLDDSPFLGFDAGVQVALDAVHAPVEYPDGFGGENGQEKRIWRCNFES